MNRSAAVNYQHLGVERRVIFRVRRDREAADFERSRPAMPGPDVSGDPTFKQFGREPHEVCGFDAGPDWPAVRQLGDEPQAVHVRMTQLMSWTPPSQKAVRSTIIALRAAIASVGCQSHLRLAATQRPSDRRVRRPSPRLPGPPARPAR